MFTIREASQYLRLPPHTLRYWEKALEGVLVPFRTYSGQRRYALEHLLMLETVKQLKRKGLTLGEIRIGLSDSLGMTRHAGRFR